MKAHRVVALIRKTHRVVALIRKTHRVVGLIRRGQGGRLVSSADVRCVGVFCRKDPVTDLAADGLRRDVLRLVVADDGASVVGLLAAGQAPPDPVQALFNRELAPV